MVPTGAHMPAAPVVAFHLGPKLVERPRTQHRYLLPDHLERHPDRPLAAFASDPRDNPRPQAGRWCGCRSWGHQSVVRHARQLSVQATAAGSMGPNVRFQGWSGRHLLIVSISEFDPTATLAVHCGNGCRFQPYQSTSLGRYNPHFPDEELNSGVLTAIQI